MQEPLNFPVGLNLPTSKLHMQANINKEKQGSPQNGAVSWLHEKETERTSVFFSISVSNSVGDTHLSIEPKGRPIASLSLSLSLFLPLSKDCISTCAVCLNYIQDWLVLNQDGGLEFRRSLPTGNLGFQ